MRRVKTLVFASMATGAGFAALAQTPIQPPRDPNMPAPQSTIPEKIQPSDPSTTGSTGSTGSGATLSEKLERTDGVIRPPDGISPDMAVPAPVPNPGTTPVIPAPGSPGGNQLIDPK
jgi:hypothetical protein